MHIDQINKYLWCSYLSPNEFPTWLYDCITPKAIGKVYSAHEAAHRFDALFDDLVDQSGSMRHLVPLSGGWDSRSILGALLERVETDRIATVSFGVPGQLDYDLGKMVADSAGVKHHALDLRSVDFAWDAIKESVASSPWTYVPDGFFNSLCRNLFSSESDAIWIGFLGDPLAGSHILDLADNRHVQLAFSAKQKRCKKPPLCLPEFFFADAFPVPEQDTSIAYDDALDLGIRQAHAIASIVLPIRTWDHWGAFIGKEKNGAQVIAPYADSAWAGYWLSAPREVRKGQKLYLEMLNLKFPELFSLPGKVNYGIKLNHGMRSMVRRSSHFFRLQMQRLVPWLRIRSSLGANYLDYDEMFRNREDYQATLRIAFEYLKENKVVSWLDLDKLWEEHMKRKNDNGDAFCVLLGLAANCVENPLE
ncbi:MAG TPA: hypothetical protein HA232_00160 [Methanocellales archaeon]|nr:hypothetical protein [Methanocellales archaeon]